MALGERAEVRAGGTKRVAGLVETRIPAATLGQLAWAVSALSSKVNVEATSASFAAVASSPDASSRREAASNAANIAVHHGRGVMLGPGRRRPLSPRRQPRSPRHRPRNPCHQPRSPRHRPRCPRHRPRSPRLRQRCSRYRTCGQVSRPLPSASLSAPAIMLPAPSASQLAQASPLPSLPTSMSVGGLAARAIYVAALAIDFAVLAGGPAAAPRGPLPSPSASILERLRPRAGAETGSRSRSWCASRASWWARRSREVAAQRQSRM